MAKNLCLALGVRKYPSITALQCFEATARHLSFTRASRELHITQSAVSKQVAQLEDLLSVPLFFRTNSGLFLSPAGKQYYVEVLKILQQLELATVDLMAYDKDKATLRIISHPTFCAKWLMMALKDFGATYPLIQLDISEQASPLLDDDVEMAFLYGDGVWANMEAVKLFDEYCVAVCSPNYRNHFEDLPSLASAELIHIRTRPRAWYDYFANQDYQPKCLSGLRLDTFNACIHAAKIGCGVALVPIRFVTHELSVGELVMAYPYQMVGHGAYYVLYQTKLASTPKIKAMVGWVQQYLTTI